MLLFFLPDRLRGIIRAHVALRIFYYVLLFAALVYWSFVGGIMLHLGHTFTDANWLAWQTSLTIGYGTNLPETVSGKWLVMMLGTLGVVSMTAMIGASVTIFQTLLEQRKGGLMKNPYKNGYVAFNFPGEGNMEEVITQMRVVNPQVPICIVDSRLDELPLRIRSMPHIHFIKGELTRPDVYERAGLEHQKAVAVLPMDRNNADSDAATASAVRMILHYLTRTGSHARVQHMLVDPDNEAMFEGLNSQVISKRLDMDCLAQEWQDEGSAEVIESFLRTNKGDDLHMVDANLVVGMTWGALRAKILELYMSDVMGFTAIALKHRGEMVVNHPHKDELIRAGDRICLLAENTFDWKAAERALTRREHEANVVPLFVSGSH